MTDEATMQKDAKARDERMTEADIAHIGIPVADDCPLRHALRLT